MIPAKAAVLYEQNGPFVIEDVMLEEPRAGEVLFRIVATGICHTDAVVRSGGIAIPMRHGLIWRGKSVRRTRSMR